MTEPRPEARDLDSNHLVEAVRRRGARHALWRVDGERSFAQNLAMIGALGWLIVTPTLMGLFLGRWLDRVGQSGIFWTGALLVVGLALGCWLAWRRMMAP